MTTTDDRPVAQELVLDQRGAAFVLAVLQTAKDTAAERYRAGQTIGAEHYFTPGDRLTIKDPVSGAKVGTAGMTDPDAKATITDPDLFAAYMAAEDPDSVTTSESIDPERLDEAYDVLRRHAPDLLVTTSHVRVQYEKAVLDQAAKTGDPVPGVEVRKPVGVVNVRLSTEGKELIRELIANGDIDALRALPAKES
jgi:hypothetical protein